MNADRLWCESLRAAPWGAAVTRILAAALGAVEPGAAVRRSLRRDGDTLLVGDAAYDLRRVGRVLLVGVGKASIPMAAAAADVLADRLAGGVVVTKDGHLGGQRGEGGGRSDRIVVPAARPPLSLFESGHPVPDERGVRAAREIAALLDGAGPDDLVLAVISGGGSALLTLPAPGVTLGDLRALTGALLASGATIDEINTLRKHLDLIKGGGMARMAGEARVAALMLSDVVGDRLDVIASGPTVPDPTSFADALLVLERRGLVEATPPAILERLRRGADGLEPETLKPGDPRFAGVQNLIVGSNRQALDAALAAAYAEGFAAEAIPGALVGEAREIGGRLAALAAGAGPRRRVLVGGGEATVTIRGGGRGGRNQEAALAAVTPLAGLDAALVTLATDGGDGPTDAAGAVVTGATLARARALGLDTSDHLARNDSYPFFDALGDLLKPGPTQTNVNDLALIFIP